MTETASTPSIQDDFAAIRDFVVSAYGNEDARADALKALDRIEAMMVPPKVIVDSEVRLTEDERQALLRAMKLPGRIIALKKAFSCTPPPPRTITAAAIFQDGKIYYVDRPGRHHDVIASMECYAANGFKQGDSVQGFLTSDGAFVDRKAAGRIALAAGQIGRLQWAPELFSEDLW